MKRMICLILVFLLLAPCPLLAKNDNNNGGGIGNDGTPPGQGGENPGNAGGNSGNSNTGGGDSGSQSQPASTGTLRPIQGFLYNTVTGDITPVYD